MAVAESGGGQPGIVTLTIKDKASLYKAYMPFIIGGGLFIAQSTRPAQAPMPALGDEIFLLLNLVEQGERLPVAGRVVWVTPKGAQGQRPPGFGIQFSGQGAAAALQKIETLLAGGIESGRPTDTL